MKLRYQRTMRDNRGNAGEMESRRATGADVPRITVIYNQGIEDRIATLETELRSEDERRQWLRGHDERHPVFVAEKDGQVIG